MISRRSIRLVKVWELDVNDGNLGAKNRKYKVFRNRKKQQLDLQSVVKYWNQFVKHSACSIVNDCGSSTDELLGSEFWTDSCR